MNYFLWTARDSSTYSFKKYNKSPSKVRTMIVIFFPLIHYTLPQMSRKHSNRQKTNEIHTD